MPVLDHEVHEKVRHGSDFRYGCHSKNNHVRKDGYFAPGRVYLKDEHDYATIHIYVHDTMSKDCRYDLSLEDKACEGCKRRGQGEQYDQFIRSQL